MLKSSAPEWEYREQSETAWREAKLKLSLDPGWFVRTGDLSTMALLLTDKTQARLAQNSMLQIKEVPDQGETILQLNAGRLWSQTKLKTAKSASILTGLTIQTFNAFAGIRGTDWEIGVDAERTRLTVLHGVVEFYNEYGRETVRSNEQAVAEKGKAPVKRLLQNPAERIQWVTSYTVDASRYRELDADALAWRATPTICTRKAKTPALGSPISNSPTCRATGWKRASPGPATTA